MLDKQLRILQKLKAKQLNGFTFLRLKAEEREKCVCLCSNGNQTFQSHFSTLNLNHLYFVCI